MAAPGNPNILPNFAPILAPAIAPPRLPERSLVSFKAGRGLGLFVKYLYLSSISFTQAAERYAKDSGRFETAKIPLNKVTVFV